MCDFSPCQELTDGVSIIGNSYTRLHAATGNHNGTHRLALTNHAG